jgi:protoporphyrin/coproporphyrin ferrochelatase
MPMNIPNLNIGILVTNLGTPEAPTVAAVRAYLKEFLSDPFVVQIPQPIWWLLLHGIVLPIRPAKSLHLYQKIWTPAGSPLLVLSQQLLKKIQKTVNLSGYAFEFALGMRYGQPAIHRALASLRERQVEQLIILPLYPQFSNTTTASTKAHVHKQLKLLKWQPELKFINHYWQEQSYITALTQSIQEHWHKQTPGQKLLFSFHGIPKKHTLKGDPYFDQCHATAKQIAHALNLDAKQWEIVFQSRFGRSQWLRPYCTERLAQLPSEGYKHIDVICPGFAVDCLETLEEIALTNQELFYASGGLSYQYIPALNDSYKHSQCLAEILIKHVFLE